MTSLASGRIRRLAAALLVVALAGGPPPARAQTERRFKVTAAVANVRSSAGPTGAVLYQVRRGDVLTVTDEVGSWYAVEGPKGKGYVFKTLGEIVVLAAPAVRAQPSAAPTSGARGVSIDHQPIGCTVAEQHPRIEACLAPAVNVGRAQVHFRASSTDPWYAVELRREGACHWAELPKPSRSIPRFEYYLDVIDAAFTEAMKPEGGPRGAYGVKVVARRPDCDDSAGRVALSAARAARPVVVSVVRDSGGKALEAAAARALESKVVLAGFRTEGVLVGSTGAAPAGAAGGGTVGEAAGSVSAGGGGIPTIALVAGGVAAVGVAVVLATGGDGSSDGRGAATTTPTTVVAAPGPGPQPGLGDLSFRLTWAGTADLDLYVQEPNGNVIFYGNTRSSTGGQLDVDSNAGCGSVSPSPIENVFWPPGSAPRGGYTFWAQYFAACADSGSKSFTIEVRRGNSVVDRRSGVVSPGGSSERFGHTY